MKKRVRARVTAAEYPRYKQQANKMIQVCQEFGKRHYDGNVIGNITVRDMCTFPSIFVDLDIEGHLCYAIFDMFRPGSVEVEAQPPRVRSVKSVQEAQELSTLYQEFASVIQSLWSALDAAAQAGKLEED